MPAQAFAAESEQRNCSNSMWKLAKDLKVEPLNCILLSLQHEPNFFLALYRREMLNSQQHLVVKVVHTPLYLT